MAGTSILRQLSAAIQPPRSILRQLSIAIQPHLHRSSGQLRITVQLPPLSAGRKQVVLRSESDVTSAKMICRVCRIPLMHIFLQQGPLPRRPCWTVWVNLLFRSRVQKLPSNQMPLSSSFIFGCSMLTPT